MIWPFKKKDKKTEEDKSLIEETKEKIKTNAEKKKEAMEEYKYLIEEDKKTKKEAKGGMINQYKKGGLVSKRTFIARGCGKVMNNRRKKTKIY